MCCNSRAVCTAAAQTLLAGSLRRLLSLDGIQWYGCRGIPSVDDTYNFDDDNIKDMDITNYKSPGPAWVPKDPPP